MTLPAILAALLLSLPAAAHADFACIQECASQGYERSRCVTLCERGSGGPGLLQQPGAPRNPYFDSLSDPVPRQPAPSLRTDSRCLDDCRAKGYKYQLCRKQCSY